MSIRAAAFWTIASAAVAVASAVAIGCGSGDDSEPAAPQTADEVRANLEDAGYVVGEDVSDSSELAPIVKAGEGGG